MSEPKVLYEIGNSDYALVGDCLYPSIRGTTPCNPKNIRKLGGDAVVVAREVLRLAAESEARREALEEALRDAVTLAAENAELRGLLEEAADDLTTRGASYKLVCRIRQSLGKGDERG